MGAVSNLDFDHCPRRSVYDFDYWKSKGLDTMTTLETLLKQVEELDAKAKETAGYIDSHIANEKYLELVSTAAPILVEVIHKLVEQRDGYAEALNLPTTNSGRKDNADLDTIVAKRLKGEE